MTDHQAAAEQAVADFPPLSPKQAQDVALLLGLVEKEDW